MEQRCKCVLQVDDCGALQISKPEMIARSDLYLALAQLRAVWRDPFDPPYMQKLTGSETGEEEGRDPVFTRFDRAGRSPGAH